MSATLFERRGGFAAARKVVSAFYDKVLESESLRGYFAEADMRRIVDHQTKFVAFALGGPVAMSDDVLQRVHAHLRVTEAHFAEMLMLMREALEEADFAPEDVELVCGELAKRAPLIIDRAA